MDSNYNIIRIQRYLEGMLSKEEMYEIEREALDDPFLSDALEGYRLQAEVNHGKLSLLQQRLAQRIEGKQEEKNRFYFTSQRLAVASVAAVLFVLAIVLFWMKATMDSSGPAEGLVEKEIFVDLNAALEISPEFMKDLNQRFQREWSGALVRVAGGESGASAADPAVEVDGEAGRTASEIYRLSFDIDADGRPQNLEVFLIGKEDSQAAPMNQGDVGEVQVEALSIDGDLHAKILNVLKDGPLWEGFQGRRVDLELRI